MLWISLTAFTSRPFSTTQWPCQDVEYLHARMASSSRKGHGHRKINCITSSSSKFRFPPGLRWHVIFSLQSFGSKPLADLLMSLLASHRIISRKHPVYMLSIDTLLRTSLEIEIPFRSGAAAGDDPSSHANVASLPILG